MTPTIYTPKIKPVHSFDLWGVLVDQPVLGPRVIAAYQDAMQGEVPAEEMTEAIRRYQGLLDGQSWAIADKKNIVDRLEDPLWDAYAEGNASVNFEGALHEDALKAITDIAVCDELYIVLTTSEAPWVQSALEQAIPSITQAMVQLYAGDKRKPETYESTFENLQQRGLTMVTHTEDQLKGFLGLLESEKDYDGSTLKERISTIFIDREPSPIETDLRAKVDVITTAGINQYVTDLQDAVYIPL